MFINHAVAWLTILAICAVIHYAVPALADEVSQESETEVNRVDYSLLARSIWSSSTQALDDQSNVLIGALQGEFKYRLTDSLAFNSEARVAYSNTASALKQPNQLLEAYLAARFPSYDIRVGRQIMIWGRADNINPTDFFTPRNFTTSLPFDEDQRSGPFLIRIDHQLSPGLQGNLVIAPEFLPSRIPLGEDINTVQHQPHAVYRHPMIGVKLDKTGGELDWSVSVFHGYNLLPVLQFGSFDDGSLTLVNTYPKITAVGADFVRTWGVNGLRGELAYIHPHSSDISDTGMQANLFSVFGYERAFTGALNFNVQLVYRHTPDLPPALKATGPEGAVARQNAITFGQLHTNTYGLTSRISKLWLNDTLKTELVIARYFVPISDYLRAEIDYAISDRWNIYFGSELYRGPEESFFGRLRSNQRLFTELRFHF